MELVGTIKATLCVVILLENGNFEHEKMSLLNRVENELVRPILRWARPSRHVRLAGIDISYRSELDGGGTEFGQEFIPFLKSRGMPKQRRAFEWCSGPGFIGFLNAWEWPL
jgi:hypothetical protein